MPQSWLRLYREIIHDPKLRGFTPGQRWFWVVLLCLADDTGAVQLAPGVPYKLSDLASVSGVRPSEISRTLARLQLLNMLSSSGEGHHFITNWDKRQFKSDDTSARVRRYRAKDINNLPRPGNVSETFLKRSDETPPEQIQNRTDTETEQITTKDICTETGKDPVSPSADLGEIILTFPCDGKSKQWLLTESYLTELQGYYPSMDVLGECRKALGWVNAKPSRKKTANGMKAFLTGWMGRNQNRGGNGKSIPTTNRTPGFCQHCNKPSATYLCHGCHMELGGTEETWKAMQQEGITK